MGLFDRFKNTKKTETKSEKKTSKKVSQESSSPVKDVRKKAARPKDKTGPATFAKSDLGRAPQVIIHPLISEKATELNTRDQYVFKVKNETNKVEIRKAISRIYGVTVTGVRIINIPRKKKRLGKFQGYKSGYKKAMVSLKKGDKIELLPH